MLRLINMGSYVNCSDDIILPHIDMPKLKSGDTISCKVKDALIVSPYRAYDEIKSFVIVAVDEHGYYLFVPHYYSLSDSFIVNRYECISLGIEQRFLDESVVYIQENMVSSIDLIKDGLSCKLCKEYVPYAESNRDDGSLICYACRQNPYR